MKDDIFLPYAKPSLDPADIQEVVKALGTSTITRGPIVEAFENAMAQYCHVKYAVAFNSGSSALMAAYFAADLGSQDKIITSPNTFVSTAGSAILRGTTPVFLDIDRATGNFNLDELEHTLTKPLSRGRVCIAPVHFAGIPVDIEKIDGMIKDPNVVVIEDAAHALGSSYKTGEKIGSCCWSAMTVFSFHPAKTLTTGEGGMVTTNDEAYYHRLRLFRNNGIERDPSYLKNKPEPWYYEVVDITGNYNFTEFQAALGLSQMARLDSFVEKRRELMKLYRSLLKNSPHIRLFAETYDAQAAYHLCVVQIDFQALKTTRSTVMNKLNEKGIGTQVHYIPLYKHPYFEKMCGDIGSYFPQTESYYYDLRPEDVERVVKTLKKVLKI